MYLVTMAEGPPGKWIRTKLVIFAGRFLYKMTLVA